MAKHNKPRYDSDYDEELEIELECSGQDAQKIISMQKREYKSKRDKSRKQWGKYF